MLSAEKDPAPLRSRPIREATARLRLLEEQIRQLDDELERLRAIGADASGTDKERVRLERRFNALHDAIGFVNTVLPRLPRCVVCGKASHATLEGAKAHLAALDAISPRGHTSPRMTLCVARRRRVGELKIYRCLLSKDQPYHVGHKVIHE
jgi:hypothetical protein